MIQLNLGRVVGKDGRDGRGVIVLANGNFGNWDEETKTYVDSGISASASVDIEGVQVAFDSAGGRVNVESGDTVPGVFGKLRKWFTDFGALAWKSKADWTSDIDNKPAIPTKTNELTNNSGFITKAVNDLANYYLKSETYTRLEVQSLISSIQKLRIELVDILPEIGESNVIYLVPKAGAGNDTKDEFIWIGAWEKIGSTEIDLSNYITIAALNSALAQKIGTTELNTGLATKANKTIFKTLVLNSANWTASGSEFKITVTDAAIADGTKVIITPSTRADLDLMAAAEVSALPDMAVGSVVLYSKTKPTSDISINYSISF